MTDPRFDTVIDRTVFPTMKWNKPAIQDLFGNPDALPFWVADMDFPAPEVVIDQVRARAEHGLYGYAFQRDSYGKSLLNWYATRHNWHIDTSHIEQCPSVLNAVTVLIDQYSNEGDGVIIQPPVFFEFNMVINSNNRQRVKNPLKVVNGQYQMDYDDLEAKAADPNNKILIVCNPHNPMGRVWTVEELTQVAEICQKYDVLVISDEIHADIVYAPHQFTSMAAISDNAVACLSPAKTFNLPGMVDALAVIPDESLRESYHDFAHRFQINKTHVFALAAMEAAYSEGGPWLDDLLAYLQGTITFMRDYLAEQIPQVTLVEPEGTYLVWLNFDGLGLEVKALEQFLAQDAGIALNAGYWFGREGAGYARMNIATPRSIIEQALHQLRAAANNL